MSDPIDVPNLALVRVLTSGGPYREGDLLSVAFTDPRAGRLVAHECASDGHALPPPGLPETISAHVERASGPYEEGALLTLSFVDPGVARIHQATVALPVAPIAETIAPNPERIVPVFEPVLPVLPAPQTIASALRAQSVGVRLTLGWSPERVRRFVQVTDKLFTVDRLGWYRHAFAMRLLVPDTIACGDAGADADASRSLRSLRAAALETLGRPLLAAFMPSFAVTPEWLDAMDGVDAAKALAALRTAIAPFASDDCVPILPDERTETSGIVSAHELANAPATSVDALLPLLIVQTSSFDDVTTSLVSYRNALIELFGQTAQSAETVRLGAMAQPNHTLDDRLWNLVGVVSERFGDLAVA